MTKWLPLLLTALVVGALVAADDGRGYPRGGGGTGTVKASTSVSSPVGNFSFVDAGTMLVGANAAFSGPVIITGSALIRGISGANGSAIDLSTGIAQMTTGAGAAAITCTNSTATCAIAGAATTTSNITANGRSASVAQPIDGGTAAVYIEYGNVTCSSSRCPVTFRNAFAVGPRCNCTMVTDGGCNLEGPASTTAVAFHAGTATAVVDWMCIGDR